MVIGITGGIGAGKSTVLSILKNQYGFVIFEADQIAHELMRKGNISYLRIVSYFGNDILDENEEIDRKKLGQKVFSNKEQLEKLNEFVHPEVISEIQRRMAMDPKRKDNGRFVIEAALLFESGCNTICDQVWYIDTNTEVRKQRLREYRKMSDEQIESVMKNQLNRDRFEQLSDVVIDNSDSVGNTAKQIQNLLEFSCCL
ncbi:MAG: dephospho-CoA kinase [Lachnospiraceae bacterium]|nr:dephospho-CoA kinase [Lachnospiraceae bacterium]